MDSNTNVEYFYNLALTSVVKMTGWVFTVHCVHAPAVLIVQFDQVPVPHLCACTQVNASCHAFTCVISKYSCTHAYVHMFAIQHPQKGARTKGEKGRE